MRTSQLLVICLLTSTILASQGHAIVFSGLDDPGLNKPDGVEAFDEIFPDLIITRSSSGGGLFNSAVEASFSGPVSPAGTLWAYANNNPNPTSDPTKVVNAGNALGLVYSPWLAAVGSPPAAVGQLGVVFIPDRDIYFEIMVTQWTGGPGAGVQYIRSIVPEPSTATLLLGGLIPLAAAGRRRHCAA